MSENGSTAFAEFQRKPIYGSKVPQYIRRSSVSSYKFRLFMGTPRIFLTPGPDSYTFGNIILVVLSSAKAAANLRGILSYGK